MPPAAQEMGTRWKASEAAPNSSCKDLSQTELELGVAAEQERLPAMQSLVRNNALHHAQAHLRPPATSAGGWSEACRQWTGRGSNTHSRTCDRTMRAFSVSLDVTGIAMIITHRHPADATGNTLIKLEHYMAKHFTSTNQDYVCFYEPVDNMPTLILFAKAVKWIMPLPLQ